MRLAAVVLLGASACATVVPVSHPSLQFSGLIDRRDAVGPRFAWSGTSLGFRFTGSSVKVVLQELSKSREEPGRWPNRFRVELDGVVTDALAAEREFVFEKHGLSDGAHAIAVYRQSEALVGASQLVSVQLSHRGTLLAPPARPSRLLLIVGDSVSTAFGIEGADETCGYTTETQNHWDSYQALAARAVSAELFTLAWSGRGLWRNYDEIPGQAPMSELWQRTLPEDPASTWSTDRSPDAVVVLLGGNDFAKGDPGAPFVDSYRALLTSLRARFPAAHLFAALDAGFRDDFPKNVKARTVGRGYLQRVVAEADDARVHFLEFTPRQKEDGLGCLYHPTRKTHARMAAELETALRDALHW